MMNARSPAFVNATWLPLCRTCIQPCRSRTVRTSAKSASGGRARIRSTSLSRLLIGTSEWYYRWYRPPIPCAAEHAVLSCPIASGNASHSDADASPRVREPRALCQQLVRLPVKDGGDRALGHGAAERQRAVVRDVAQPAAHDGIREAEHRRPAVVFQALIEAVARDAALEEQAVVELQPVHLLLTPQRRVDTL